MISPQRPCLAHTRAHTHTHTHTHTKRALHQGQFTVSSLARLQSRAYLPTFCFDDTRGRHEVMEGNVAALLAQVSATHATLQPGMLLVIVRDLAGNSS